MSMLVGRQFYKRCALYVYTVILHLFSTGLRAFHWTGILLMALNFGTRQHWRVFYNNFSLSSLFTSHLSGGSPWANLWEAKWKYQLWQFPACVNLIFVTTTTKLSLLVSANLYIFKYKYQFMEICSKVERIRRQTKPIRQTIDIFSLNMTDFSNPKYRVCWSQMIMELIVSI